MQAIKSLRYTKHTFEDATSHCESCLGVLLSQVPWVEDGPAIEDVKEVDGLHKASPARPQVRV